MIGRVAGALDHCKKFIPGSGEVTKSARLQEELERIALTAPHMLADIGFERDPMACSSDRAVWRRGTHCVVIFSPRHAAAFV